MSTLQEKDELLLMRWHDGECNLLTSWRARRLLAQREDARLFIEAMKAISQDICAVDRGDPVNTVSRCRSLWPDILFSIRAPGGSSEIRPVAVSFYQRINAFGWGLSGAVIAATITVLLMPGEQSTLGIASSGSPVSQLSAPEVALSATQAPAVSLAGGSSSPASSYEIEWLRSSGRARIYRQGGSSSAPVIWVKKRRGRDTVLLSEGLGEYSLPAEPSFNFGEFTIPENEMHYVYK